MQNIWTLTKPKIRLKQAEVGKPDYWLLAIVAVLLVLGTIMVYSASFVTAAQTDGNPAYYLWRHLLWVLLGLGGGFAVLQIDYHVWRRFSIGLMMAVMALLLAVLVLPSQFAPNIAGARRWIVVSSDSNWLLQPSELAKLALILYGAHWLSSKRDKVRNFYYGLLPFALTVGFLIALIMGEPDLGTSMVIGAIGLTMFFVAGANIMHLLAGLGAAGFGFYVLATTAAYRLNRIAAYQDPFSDPTGLGYHTSQALIGLGSGGFFGIGLGVSRQKFLWLPTVFTDSIFAVLGEELGLIGTTLVVLLFLAFAWRGFRIALHAQDGFGRLIASGVTIYVVSQAFLNIAVVTNLVPFTGIPLPFISFGGSSLSVTLLGLGLLLNVSRTQVANPHLVEVEERRRLENEQRELLREQRKAQREQRDQTLKLRSAEYEQKQADEVAQAQKRWYERTRSEREAQRLSEAAERESKLEREARLETMRQKLEQGAEKIRQQEVQPLKTVVDQTVDQTQAHEEAEELPDVAATSFLDFRKTSDSEPPVESSEEHLRPKIQRPRRDWAKVYHAAQRRRDTRQEE